MNAVYIGGQRRISCRSFSDIKFPANQEHSQNFPNVLAMFSQRYEQTFF